MGELQRRLLLAPGTVTGLVDGLVAEGLVRRWRDENDRRLVFLDLTTTGEEFLAGILDFRSDVLARAMAGPDETQALDAGQLNAALRVILTNLRKQCKGERERCWLEPRKIISGMPFLVPPWVPCYQFSIVIPC
ncbi:MarR family winged helix-turn-helix transcriptional regulator [Moorella naiadis]|uniref:MarR family winged helix-turn-helix transcriptional regulator n=1 Tax=Moorella naiadis (nom. illeg.) TaxID=3093670 RepID=UPI003D9CA158